MANAHAKSAKSRNRSAKAPRKVVKAAKAVPKPAPKSVPKPVSKPAPKAKKIDNIARPIAVVAPIAKPERLPEKVDIKVSAQPEPFRLAAIERADPPSGAAGKNWYRYTIRQGVNAINGYLQGTAAGVKTAAEQIVGQLNERRAGRWGYRTTRAAAPAATTT